VTYVSGRSTALSSALALASAVAWVTGRDRSRRWLVFGLSPLLFALALAVKESVVVLPLALLLLAAVDGRRAFSWREAGRDVSAHLAVLVAGLIAFAAAPTYRSMLARSFELRGAVENVATQLQAITYLTAQLVAVDRLNADPLLPSAASEGALVGAGRAMAVLLVVAGALSLVRRRPAASFGVLWFVLWLAPAGWIVPRAEPVNDRMLYLSLLGPAWLVARWLAPAVTRPGFRRVAAAGLLVALGAATSARNRVYRDEVAFWEDVLRKSPGNARAHNNLGYALAERSQAREAEAAFRRALALDPENVRAAVNLRFLEEGGCEAVTGGRASPVPNDR
jgi:tetratricopeptide (TPR) repeat protein